MEEAKEPQGWIVSDHGVYTVSSIVSFDRAPPLERAASLHMPMFGSGSCSSPSSGTTHS